jgi:hypothetical protein
MPCQPIPSHGGTAWARIFVLVAVASAAPPLVAGEEPSAPAAPSTSIPASALATPEDSVWRGTLELYGFAPLRTTGTTTIRGFEAEIDTSLGELIPLIETVGSVRGSIERGRVGLLTDLSYVQIGDEVAFTGRRERLTGRVDQTSIQGVYDLAFRYRWGAPEAAIGRPGQLTLLPYGGVRLLKSQLDLGAVIEGTGPRRLRLQKQGSWERTWTQPLLGTQASLFLTPGVRAFARGDVGGFGLAGKQDLSGNAQLGVGIALGNRSELDLSWRYFGLVYNNGARRETGLESYQNGVEIGLKLFF